MVKIKVLGPGCFNCNKLEAMCREVVAENDIEANIEKISDISKFADYGLLITPGLVINEKLVSSGKLPTRSELTQLITEAV